MKNFSSNNSGQIGVVILLIMAVLLTIGLSIASRSTQDLFLSSQTAESSRVFNAAEAGLEKAMGMDLVFEGDTTGGTLSDIGEVGVSYRITKFRHLETRLFEGMSIKVDLTGATSGRVLRIEWARSASCATDNPASMLIDIYNQTAGQTTVRHLGFSACDHSDGLTPGTVIAGGNYLRAAEITLSDGDLLARVKPIYNDTFAKVEGLNWPDFPVQYYNIKSEAKSDLGDETRIVEVNQTLPSAPGLMDFALYSGNALTK